MKRRTFLAAALSGALGVTALARGEERVIRIVARKFEFTPNEITLNKGEPVVLELTTEDVTMGFYVQELGAHAEIVPGKVTQVRLLPDKTGKFDFICDVFCGEGHEDMAGTIQVIG